MQFAKPRHQGRHVAAAKASRCGDAQMSAGLDTSGADTGFGIGQIRQQALAVFQKGTALVGQRDAPCGAQQQLDAQSLFQAVQAPPHDGGGHARGTGRRRQAAARDHGHKGFQLLELVHFSSSGSEWQCVLLRVPRPLRGLLLYLRKTHYHPAL